MTSKRAEFILTAYGKHWRSPHDLLAIMRECKSSSLRHTLLTDAATCLYKKAMGY